MQGKIIKGIAGFYYVYVDEAGVYECKAKGIFRKNKVKPLVGDDVEIELLGQKEKVGNVIRIMPRKNELIRPAVANVDQALVIFAAAQPQPNFLLLDRFLVMMERQEIPVKICFNKKDLVSENECQSVCQIYSDCGYDVVWTSALLQDGREEIRQLLRGKTTVVAGPSGVGKSSLTNLVQSEVQMEIGEISQKLKRGKHTTRHSEIIPVEPGTYLVDTPGFSSLYLENIEREELRNYFTEFREYEDSCKFQGCAHVQEPQCGVKAALEEGKISRQRYENYLTLYQESSAKRRY